MCYAVFSDVHGNKEALDAVLEDMAGFDIRTAYCLGDVIGYGADPEACLDAVQKKAEICILGNHEHALLNPVEKAGMNEVAAQAIVWTWKHITPEHMDLIRTWPMVKVGTDARLVHGSPRHPLEFRYTRYRWEQEAAFDAFSESICFHGHTHRTAAFRQGQAGNVSEDKAICLPSNDRLEESRLALNNSVRFLINVGSVGQPRDGDPRARWVMVRNDPPELVFRYVPYNVEKAQQKILQAGLPSFLAERLRLGQ